MTSSKLLLLLVLALCQTTVFVSGWWAKDYVCSSTCTTRFCPFGYLEKGCPRCTCSQNPCSLNTCGPGFRCETKPTECSAVFRCPHEFVCVRDNRTVCPETCPEKDCPHGFLEVGCPRCQCAENPCKPNSCNTLFERCVSTPINCFTRTNCPHRARCQIQSAKPRIGTIPTAGPKVNPISVVPTYTSCSTTCSGKTCTYGFLTSGCPRCTCAPNPCLQKRCGSGLVCHSQPAPCKYSNRCPYEAICRDSACENVCRKRCAYGFLMTGCPRCTCAPNPCLRKSCPSGQHCVSEPAKCRFIRNCYHMAVCKPNVCSDVCPGKTCPFGFQSIGCPRCDCVVDPCRATRCAPGQGCTTEVGTCPFGANCPRVPVCKSVCEATTRQSCRFGFLSRGCPRSQCAPDPCRNKNCPGNSACESRPGQCEFTAGCPHVATCQPAAACESSCRIACKFGMVAEGCPRCKCAPDPCQDFTCLWGSCVPTDAPCEFSTNCPQKPSCVAPCQETCRKTCQFGFLNSGCPRCQCATNPCAQNPCPSGSECSTRPVSCPFPSGCPHEPYCRKSRTKHRCLQPRHSGGRNCNKRIQRYYFNYSQRRCMSFTYRGCGGTVNNFSNYWTCLLTCRLVF